MYRRRNKLFSNLRRFVSANRKGLLITVLIVAAAAAVLFSMRHMAARNDYASSFLNTKDAITIGIRTDVPGFGEVDENGEIIGFDRDLIDLILGRLIGSEEKIYSYVPLTSQNAGAALKYGVADICLGQLTSGMLQTNGFTLTDPYFRDRVVAVVPDNSQIVSIREVPGSIGLLTTAVPAETARTELEAIDMPTDLTSYSDYESALTDLTYGRISTVLMPYETARQFTRDGYRILPEELFSIGYGILLPTGQDAVAAQFNAAIAQLQENGTIGALRTKWNV
ncbi:MAG: transporter substrate-binding domain-containing protein [Clostridia bacterium]|nr:transporter substrate-binding domain-containing protein [Clostridia bacterium]